MIGFIGTSLQLNLTITAHELKSSSIMTHVWRMLYEESLAFTNQIPLITAREQNRHRLQRFYYCSSWMRCFGNVHEPFPSKMDNFVSGSIISDFRRCLPSRCLANGVSGLLSQKPVLASRCLAMDYSGFHTSCHNIYIPNWSVLFQSVMCLQFGEMLPGTYRSSKHALSCR
jgi:hypothetical protein